MSIFTTRPWLRWVVPAGVVVVLISGGAVARTVIASAEPALPARSAAQLLVDLQTAKLDGLSGTVAQRADLGIPALPPSVAQGGFDVTTLLAGTHTLKVWYAGPDKTRLALISTLGEADIIRSGRDMWTWDSQRNTASHVRLPAGMEGTRSPVDALPIDPKVAADMALKAVDPTTAVSTADNARVAGRSAYELVLKPRDTASLVGEVRVAIDATEHVPLRVQVYPRGKDAAAYEVAFTSVSFARPDDAQFRFNPPPGATVKEESPQTVFGQAAPQATGQQATGQQPPVAMVGKGWTSVLVTRLPQAFSSAEPGTNRAAAGNSMNALLKQLPQVSGAWGTGRMLSGRLFSALFTDDGRVLVGAVSPDRLTQAAADPAAALKEGK